MRLAGLVDMTGVTDIAEEIKRHLESVNDFRYLTVGAKKDTRGISPQYNAHHMAKAIGIDLGQTVAPSPSILAMYAVSLISAGIFERGMTKAQARRLLLGMDKEREKEWGSKSAFNDAFFKAQRDMNDADYEYFVRSILGKYLQLQDARK